MGGLAYLCLLSFALIFYLERIAILDASFQMFLVLKTNNWAIQVNRFGAFITQIYPLLASKAGLNFVWVSKLYSISFVLFPLGIFLLLGLRLKEKGMALGLILFSILMSRYTFYWIQSELIQGIVYTFLYIGVSRKANRMVNSYWIIGLKFLLLVTIAFCHPLLLFALVFYWLNDSVDNRNGNRVYWGDFLFFICLLIIKQQFFKNWYDSQSYSNLKNFITWFPKYWTMPSNKLFLKTILFDYWIFGLFVLITVASLLYQKFYKKLILLCLFSSAYLFLLNVTYADGADQFYIESMYLLLSFYFIISFVTNVLPLLLGFKWIEPFVAVLFLSCLIQIYARHSTFTKRVDWNKKVLSQAVASKHDKVFITKAQVPKDTVLMDWGISYENWVLSNIIYGRTISVSIEEQPGELEWAINKNKTFVSKFGTWDYSEFPKNYFGFGDTTNYIRLNLN